MKPTRTRRVGAPVRTRCTWPGCQQQKANPRHPTARYCAEHARLSLRMGQRARRRKDRQVHVRARQAQPPKPTPAGWTSLGVPTDLRGPAAKMMRRLLSVQAGRTGPNTDFITGETESEQRRATQRAIRRGVLFEDD